MTSWLVGVFIGIPTVSEQAKVVGALVRNVKERSHHLTTGIIGTRVLLQSLPTDTAYALAVQDTYPVSLTQQQSCDAHSPTTDIVNCLYADREDLT